MVNKFVLISNYREVCRLKGKSYIYAIIIVLGLLVKNTKGVNYLPKKQTYKPGTIVPRSGQAEIVGPRGGKTTESERTIVKGERFPPTPKSDQQYIIVDPSKRKKR